MGHLTQLAPVPLCTASICTPSPFAVLDIPQTLPISGHPLLLSWAFPRHFPSAGHPLVLAGTFPKHFPTTTTNTTAMWYMHNLHTQSRQLELSHIATGPSICQTVATGPFKQRTSHALIIIQHTAIHQPITAPSNPPSFENKLAQHDVRDSKCA
jgi:hypothetical protein